MKCMTCGKTVVNHKFCSKECYWVSLRGIKNDKAPNWKGDNVGKITVHRWLDINFGRHRICEIGNCTRPSIVYDWALKTGKKYEKKRENFLRLCRSCHRRYDLTPQKRKLAIKNLWWNTDGINPKFRNKNGTK